MLARRKKWQRTNERSAAGNFVIAAKWIIPRECSACIDWRQRRSQNTIIGGAFREVRQIAYMR